MRTRGEIEQAIGRGSLVKMPYLMAEILLDIRDMESEALRISKDLSNTLDNLQERVRRLEEKG